MPNFNIVIENKVNNSFRTQSIIDRYELKPEHNNFTLLGNLEIENKDWNVGLIVGGSGTGKSTLAKKLFDYNKLSTWGEGALIDEVSKTKSIDEITKVFNSIGLGTAWSWLKPYQVLSEGEKMRADLSRELLSDKDLIVFDEFTSVVDRQVGKVVSFCCQKTVRKQKKKFVAVSCHRDIIEWLEPDWIFDTDKQEFFFVQESTKDQRSNLIYSKQIERTGDFLKSITI